MNRRKQIGKNIFLVLAILFLIGVIAQIFLAGLAIFASPVHWIKHITLIHLFGFNIPLFMLLFAWMGAMPRWAYGAVFGLLTSVFAMYFTGNMAAKLPWIAALHPVIAIVLFVIAFVVVIETVKLISNKKGVK
ncbi:DUF6220 domain-containing protein [Oceanobacillus polygoni]|uniref:Signal transduction histidine kinase n=1 Tax=Oceanobacillus polygoni TaxID=1235259 RepID=A0A9X0YWP5_9BACI|nr:DUF6220 domain-containing protein [Oceanobacillus polygoni]MBP2079927.1 signal transduction histidine kinase [Oceanobacillus polygoni]